MRCLRVGRGSLAEQAKGEDDDDDDDDDDDGSNRSRLRLCAGLWV